MRFLRATSPLDDLIGGLASDTMREMLASHDPLSRESWYERVFRALASAIAHELRRPGTILPDFIARRTDFGDRKERSPLQNYWGYHVGEGILTKAPLKAGYDWPRALGHAHFVVIESVFAELREEGVL